MKYIVKSIWMLLGILVISCNEGIDPITAVDAGVDESAPQVTITYPTEGVELMPFEEETSIDIAFEVTDDIEVSSVSVAMDGSQIASFSSFKDYRIVLEEVTYDGLGNGDHVVTVTATDIEGKTTTEEVNFAKLAPYSAQFDGEVFYMPFNADYMDFISFQEAGEVGNPGFSGDGFLGADAFEGAADSYLTFPMDGLKSPEFSAAFWYKVNATPDRAGILVVGDDADDRNQGFRLFREGNADEQRIKVNVGTGAAESWNDGGVIDVTAGEWVHVAVSISQTQSTIYFNGVEMLTADLPAPIDWTGCEELHIGSGGPTFDYWNHGYDASQMDELRIFNKALTQSDIQIMINAANPYMPQYAGESLYMPFDGDYIDLIGSKAASTVGSPSFTDESQVGGQAYLGATDSYINYPAEGLMSAEFSGSFWYKVDSTPDRAGIITIGDDAADRNQGFRLFREGSADEQRIKINVGTGSGESWNDGDVIDVTAGEWVHIAFTISSTESVIYFNGAEVLSSAMSAPIDWTGCDTFTIGAGGPTFDYWGHASDNSIIDDLRFFSKALTAEEVAEVFGGEVTPKNFGSTLYMPFDGTNVDDSSGSTATVEGTPGFAGESVVGSDAYAGATDSYLTFPIDGLFSNQFSGAFWYKVSGDPDRAGILTVAPPMNGTDNDLSSGFRLFREGSADEQRIKLHLGTDAGDVWNDGDVIDVTANEWVHVAFTVTETQTLIYLNGEPVVNTGDMDGKTISWANCTILSIGSGAPNFSGWNHLSDSSFIDDLFLFDRALTQEEIQEIMNN
ncbi:LamG-like jellyroll fold domain-containing protein [Flagellimonas zhangzhouensis]|uniref:Concanavalin A-like lectin/glucanases superfamily protein n=1 Tax=Flagellimonas zhangzhouensis TaxID=1073328 RepID=A0A1H2RI17_9FLAO|nr:LamG-like jellyroll fold domain-containing protein [Allomuricauda zhangzhouensis]SDQ63856.1 Concanavalin A-like lectin/glucanases superfamily protein [Allomuricauda zhangzhouensis]SDW18820.1 Concanavalin A-like lectin/glucanases superfamily protein [Allomuricauda zhangzhouensis]